MKIVFLPKSSDILQKKAEISKIKGVLLQEGVFSETTYRSVLSNQSSSIILTVLDRGGREAGNFPSAAKRTHRKPTHNRVKGYMNFTLSIKLSPS